MCPETKRQNQITFVIQTVATPVTLTLYSHNLSGARTKAYKINDVLANTNYDIIYLQETWWNTHTIDDEIIGATNFKLELGDRSLFDNSKKIGGGIAFAFNIHERFVYERITLQRTKIECAAVRMKIANIFWCFINVYMPPYGANQRMTMVTELSKVLKGLRVKYPNDELPVVGDFNMHNIKWEYENEEPGYLRVIPTVHALKAYESKFIEVCNSFGLLQINESPNTAGNFLDLVLSTDCTNIETQIPESSTLFDDNS